MRGYDEELGLFKPAFNRRGVKKHPHWLIIIVDVDIISIASILLLIPKSDSTKCTDSIKYALNRPSVPSTFRNKQRNGNVPDSSVLNTMVLCLVKLRRFDEARADLDRVLASSYVPSNNACSLVVDELCNKDEYLEAYLYIFE
ncbi:hypothetical protein YC2023_105520 [Brassica napus]